MIILISFLREEFVRIWTELTLDKTFSLMVMELQDPLHQVNMYELLKTDT